MRSTSLVLFFAAAASATDPYPSFSHDHARYDHKDPLGSIKEGYQYTMPQESYPAFSEHHAWHDVNHREYQRRGVSGAVDYPPVPRNHAWFDANDDREYQHKQASGAEDLSVVKDQSDDSFERWYNNHNFGDEVDPSVAKDKDESKDSFERWYDNYNFGDDINYD